MDAEMDLYTEVALELLCGQLVLVSVLERQAKTRLPGSLYWVASDTFKETTSHVKKTNIDSERDMAIIDGCPAWPSKRRKLR